MRAMLLQILFSIRSERQLMERTQYNMLFRLLIGLSMETTRYGCRPCSRTTGTA